MQIPDHLQHFHEPALIVTTDHEQARYWLAFEDTLEEVDTVEVRPTLDTDNEGSFVNTDSGAVNAPEHEHVDRERFRKFIEAVSNRIIELVRHEDAARTVHLVAPADVAHALHAELPKDVEPLIAKEIHVEVMKEDPLKILERIAAAD